MVTEYGQGLILIEKAWAEPAQSATHHAELAKMAKRTACWTRQMMSQPVMVAEYGQGLTEAAYVTVVVLMVKAARAAGWLRPGGMAMRVTEKMKTAEAGAAGTCQRGRENRSSLSAYPNAETEIVMVVELLLRKAMVIFESGGPRK
jgi:hypothetical protein